ADSLYPEKIGVIDGHRSFRYKEIKERVCALAGFFQERGIQPGDRISILDVNSSAFFENYYAAAGIGAIFSPLNHRLSAEELAYILRDAGTRWLVVNFRFNLLVKKILTDSTLLEGILWIGKTPSLSAGISCYEYEKIIGRNPAPFKPVPIRDDQVAQLYYTSGTTGKPKGVMLTHKNVYLHALGAIAELKLVDTDIWGHIAPMFHLADAWATFAITWVGGQHVMIRQFEAEHVMATIEKDHITMSNLIPTMLNLMIKHSRVQDYDYSRLRAILSGGAPIAPQLVQHIIQTFSCDYIQTYGMTETSPYLTLSVLKEHLQTLPVEERLAYKAKTGRPFITVDLQVMGKSNKPVIPDSQQVGEIWVRGDTITPGYWKRPEETQNAFSGGWLRTGDLAVLDKEGYINIVDRKKDMIISGGENIYSTEVENVLYRHPKVLEAAVIGIPDEKWGEAVKAVIVLKPTEKATEEEIIGFCKLHQASYKAPKSVDFLTELPKTGSGKIFKKALRDPYWPEK
ncbi:MAG: long-chain-fatty-acid--CoA ligase, partial [Desulfobacterales bacterium]